jgi:glycosyltransferase involved in cell wall biosynthesis
MIGVVSENLDPLEAAHTVSVVIPVYGGENSLNAVVSEIESLTHPTKSKLGHTFVVTEVILVHDCGPDNSGEVIRLLGSKFPWVQAVWLSRNYGQHAATLAGMAATSADWIITIDEDGQHDPTYFSSFIDLAISDQLQLVYAQPDSAPPHSKIRNLFSSFTKKVVSSLLTGGEVKSFNSYRLVLGEIGRTLAAYANNGVYLDVAFSWVVQDIGYCSTNPRLEQGRQSGYNRRALISHFWRLILSAGTRPLRLASISGIIFFVVGFAVAISVALIRLTRGYESAGWASLFALLLVVGGAIMLVLGILAEYLGIVVRSSIGRPMYLVVGDPQKSAHKRDQKTQISE